MADNTQPPPTIDLDGVRLRPLRVADADALYAYLRDPAVTELTSYPVVSVLAVEAARTLIVFSGATIIPLHFLAPAATRPS